MLWGRELGTVEESSQELLTGQDFGLIRMRAMLWNPGGLYFPLVYFSHTPCFLVRVSEGSHNWILLVSLGLPMLDQPPELLASLRTTEQSMCVIAFQLYFL